MAVEIIVNIPEEDMVAMVIKMVPSTTEIAATTGIILLARGMHWKSDNKRKKIRMRKESGGRKSMWDYLRHHNLASQREIEESESMKRRRRIISIGGRKIKMR